MKGLRFPFALGLVMVTLLGSHSLSASPNSTLHVRNQRNGKQARQTAPLFRLTDTNGKKRSLADYHGKPIAVFFFCGCPWCIRCAQDWSQFQRGGALPSSTFVPTGSTVPNAQPVTLVVFSGDAAAARDFALSTSLVPDQTVLLPDTSMHVTLDLYHAEPCPRVFVVDAQGRLRYTNNHKDDAARQAPEMVIASRALDALRSCEAQANTASPMQETVTGNKTKIAR